MKFLSSICLFVLAFAFISCGDQERSVDDASILTPSSSGRPYEIMVVAEDSIWDGYVGRALDDVLNTPLKGLPQEESLFHVSHIVPEHYDRVTNLFRNIIVIDIGELYTKASFKIVRNLHAAPQMIMTIQGPSVLDVSVFITENTKFITDFFGNEEINRAVRALNKRHNLEFSKKVQEMFGCDMYIPVDINKMKVGDNFIWASNDALTGIQNIVIYSYPYVSEKVFTKHAYVALRDSFMKVNIPGGQPNQYMATDYEHVDVKNMKIQDSFVQEARGLWQMENDGMGGPFVAHSVVDTVNNRVVVVEGFVYAPEKMKRSMVRRLEASLYTLKLPSGKDAEKKEDKK